MAVHRVVWNASSIATWEWIGGCFSGLCVACGLRARTHCWKRSGQPPQTFLCFALSQAAWPFPSCRSGQGRDFGHQYPLSVCLPDFLINTSQLLDACGTAEKKQDFFSALTSKTLSKNEEIAFYLQIKMWILRAESLCWNLLNKLKLS